MFSVLMSVAMFFMPESPYYLISKDKMEDAKKSLTWLRGSDYDITKDIGELHTTYQDQSKTGTVSLKELVSKVDGLRVHIL